MDHGASDQPAKPANGAAKPASAGKAPEAPKCDRAEFRVAVDVGHTAEVPGATSARGAPEYDFNLHLAKLVEQDLLAAGFARTVLLITEGPARASLVKRVEAANNASADLFLSIHHDSVPDTMLQDWTYEGQPQHYSDRFKGHSLYVSYDNPNIKDSLRFAHLLGLQLKDRGLKYTPHYTEAIMGRYRHQLLDAEAGVYRYDDLVVLRSTEMPAVLLEGGSIINRDEELAMATPERQALIATSVVDAVTAFCASRVPRTRIAKQPAADTAKPSTASAGSTSIFAPLIKLFKGK
jgi:N-acetylmuramoyl-L-alanine amidase